MSLKLSVLMICITFIGLQQGSTHAQTAPLWGSLEAGPYDVGFQRAWTLDLYRVWSRSPALDSLQGVVARPIRVDVWHPARCAGDRMPLARYVKMQPPDSHFEDLVYLTHRWDEYSYRGLVPDSTTFERLMETQTAACFESEPEPGPFPLVVYSAGWFNRTPDNTVLAEFLASHGFVVAAVPQLNPGLWTFNFTSDPQSIENQVRDLEVAVAVLRQTSFVDRRRIAAMGYSTGGDVVLLLQGRNPMIDVVVGLDASWTLGSDNDVIESPFFVPPQHDAPIFAARRPTVEAPSANAVLDSLKATPRIVVEVPGADHGSFSDDTRLRDLLGFEPSDAPTAHAAIAHAVLNFLRATLGDEREFDGEQLAELYRSLGLRAKFLADRNETGGHAEYPQLTL